VTARRQGDIRGWAFSCTCLLIALLPTVVAAQGEKDAVAGVVQDQTGAVVPGVQITLSDEAGLVVATTQTTTAGLFTFEHVRPGSYELRRRFPVSRTPQCAYD